MDTIALGTQGLVVSKLGFGCMGLTTAYGNKLPDDQIIALLEKTSQQGITLWDTANIYLFFDLKRILTFRSPLVCQEEIIAHAIHKVGRDKVVIATKTGLDIRIFPRIKLLPNGKPDFIRAQCEASLRRLGVDYLDLFYLHRIDPDTPIEISMTEMKKLVQEGKVRYVGLSECSASTIRRAHKIHPITAVQMEWSLWCRDIENQIVPTCAELGIGVVAYSPLGRGFFGGVDPKKLSKSDYRQSQARFHGEAGDKNRKMLDDLQKIAENKGCTSAQLALAWLQAQQSKLGGAGVVAIPGTTKERHLLSNVEATRIQLSPDDISAMEAAVPWEQVQGERYDESIGTWQGDKNRELTPEEASELGLSS